VSIRPALLEHGIIDTQMRLLAPLAVCVVLLSNTGTARVTTASPAAEDPIQLTTSTGTIRGRLLTPSRAGKVPVALIIAGSGPTDRDGNSPLLPGKNDAYKMLAEALGADGIASVRYDKRGIGESRPAGPPSEASLQFDTYVADAAAWVTQLAADERFSRVIVVGHSEGSLIGMLAARKTSAAAFVSIAGAARRASDILRDQLRQQLTGMPVLLDATETVIKSLEAGTVVDPLPLPIPAVPPLASLFRPSVQPYLISWIKYLPSNELKDLTIPVLILQGTTDLQVTVDEAKALKAAKRDAELRIIDGMNHVMKAAPADPILNVATYSNPDLKIVQDVPKAIVELARRLDRKLP
jgi:pimeloyl-ACP methyl ester carboxylesterase